MPDDWWGAGFLTGLFYSIYGVADISFGVFFVYVWWRYRKLTP